MINANFAQTKSVTVENKDYIVRRNAQAQS